MIAIVLFVFLVSCNSNETENNYNNEINKTAFEENKDSDCKIEFDTIDFKLTKNWVLYNEIYKRYITTSSVDSLSLCYEFFIYKNTITSEKFSYVNRFIDSISLITNSQTKFRNLKILLSVPSYNVVHFNNYKNTRDKLISEIIIDSSSSLNNLEKEEKRLLIKIAEDGDRTKIDQLLSEELNMKSIYFISNIEKKNYYSFVYLLRLHYRSKYTLSEVIELNNFLLRKQ